MFLQLGLIRLTRVCKLVCQVSRNSKLSRFSFTEGGEGGGGEQRSGGAAFFPQHKHARLLNDKNI